MSGVHVEEERVRGLLSHNVHDPAFLAMLGRYRRLLSSVYGPRGSSILVNNAAGSEALVSSSAEIIKQIPFAHPCVKYINAMISAQNTSCGLNGLYVGVLCVRLLEESLKCEEDLPHSVVSLVSEHIVTHLLDLLSDSPGQVVMDLDIGDMDQVMAFVKTILGAKSTLNLTQPVIDCLSLNIVKAFLKSVPNEYSSEGFGHVSVITQEDSSSMESQVFDGVLYREPDLSPERIARFHGQGNSKVLLFTIALTYAEEESVAVRWGGLGTKEENFVNFILPCLTRTMRERGIHILAIQKTIDPVIKFELERRRYLVLERLGTNATEAIERISGCQPITSLSDLPLQLANITLGTLTSVEHVVCGEKSYVLLDHCEGTVSSLLLPSASPTVISTLKDTVESCLAALRMVVVDGKVVAGGGCLETWVASQLSHTLTSTTTTIPPLPDITSHQLARVGNVFVRVLMELALLPSGGLASKLDWSIDSVFHHLWHTPPTIVQEFGTTEHMAKRDSKASGSNKDGSKNIAGTDNVSMIHSITRTLITDKTGNTSWTPNISRTEAHTSGNIANTNNTIIPKHCVCGLVQRDEIQYKYSGRWQPLEMKINPVPGWSPQRRGKTGKAGGTSDGNADSNCSDDRPGRRCMEEDSLEGSQSTSEEDVDSLENLEKVFCSQEGENDSLEGVLDSFDEEDDEDSLEGLLDRVTEPEYKERATPPEAKLEGHVPGALYDSFPAKFNSMRLALEGFMQLLHIGQCVFDQ